MQQAHSKNLQKQKLKRSEHQPATGAWQETTNTKQVRFFMDSNRPAVTPESGVWLGPEARTPGAGSGSGVAPGLGFANTRENEEIVTKGSTPVHAEPGTGRAAGRAPGVQYHPAAARSTQLQCQELQIEADAQQEHGCPSHVKGTVFPPPGMPQVLQRLPWGLALYLGGFWRESARTMVRYSLKLRKCRKA